MLSEEAFPYMMSIQTAFESVPLRALYDNLFGKKPTEEELPWHSITLDQALDPYFVELEAITQLGVVEYNRDSRITSEMILNLREWAISNNLMNIDDIIDNHKKKASN